MFFIVNVDENWGIGAANGMLVHLKSDLRFFKQMTMGKTVLMGRKTYESLPGKKPLPGRRNVILTRSEICPEGFEVVKSLAEALALARTIPEDDFVIMGGGSIYRLFLPYCNKAIITKIHTAFQGVETTIPNLDELEDWKVMEETPTIPDEQFEYHRVTYFNTSVKEY